MFRKIIIFILALFLAAPVTPADDSSITPVLWLFAINNVLESTELQRFFNDIDNIYEMTGESISLHPDKIVKTYYFSSDGNIYEMTGESISLHPDKIIKTYYFSSDGNIYEMTGESISLHPDKIIKTYYLH